MLDEVTSLRESLPAGFSFVGVDPQDKRYVTVRAPKNLRVNGEGGVFDQILKATGARRIYHDPGHNNDEYVLKL